MSDFRVRGANLRVINSLPKCLSIPTYRLLDPRNGGVQDEALPFTGPVVLTKMVDGR
jgi:hypothetical protein